MVFPVNFTIAFSSSYGSSHGSISGFNESQNLPVSQPLTSQEGSCCKKHLKYFQKPAKSGKKQIIEDCIIDIHALYSSTHNRYLKPPFSHNILHVCALAICSVSTRQQEVSEVYRFLMACFPYFKIAGQHWKNSLRHSLATCGWFAKSDSPRTAKKGYKYTIRLTVCEFLIKMGLITLSHEKLAELRQKNREFYTSFPDGIEIEILKNNGAEAS
ncbi:fork head domain-containing protein FD4-like [Tetranychus urticae]|uniref:fork head domain-containing protein FD4-like n=1 Tax=Tetranychus urticae TaxID=32264 RepID=UPI000D656D3F|nr:fork head domain-containing protein FD4-like [Tetranychus urticae]